MEASEGAVGLDPVDVEELYAGPLETFIEARTALVKRLRSVGDREAAAEAGRLRKPTVPAWAVGQLARGQGDDLEALFEANDRLRVAQSGGRDAGGREAFRAAAEDRQRLVAKLTDAAAVILRGAGLGDARATVDRVAATLMATAADPIGAGLVRRGMLVQELGAEADLGGFGLLVGVPTPDPADDHADDERVRRREEEHRTRVEAAEQQAGRLKADASVVEAAARIAAEAAQEAEGHGAALRKEADKAARAARRARARVAEALAELRRVSETR